jgi:hypothetical protein
MRTTILWLMRLASLAALLPVHASCGLYAGKADASLFNQAR